MKINKWEVMSLSIAPPPTFTQNSSHLCPYTRLSQQKWSMKSIAEMLGLLLKDIFNNNQLIISRKLYKHPSRSYQISRFTDARSCHHNVIAGNIIKITMTVITRMASSTLWLMAVKHISFILTMQCVTPMDSWPQISSLELDSHRKSSQIYTCGVAI